MDLKMAHANVFHAVGSFLLGEPWLQESGVFLFKALLYEQAKVLYVTTVYMYIVLILGKVMTLH